MSTATENFVEECVQAGYGHLNVLFTKLSRQGILFTEAGKARLSHIYGYIAGVYAASEKDAEMRAFAEKLAKDLSDNLQRLNSADQEITATFSAENTFDVPAKKIVLSDDGTLHGFSFCCYYPVQPLVFADTCNSIAEETWIENDAKAHLQICEKGGDETLTTYTRHGDVYYRFAYNGGLLYHGPGGGEVFAVTVESNPLWSIHT